MNETKWSKKEKAIARQVFDNTYENEFKDLVEKARGMVGNIVDPDDIWDIYNFLRKKRKELAEKYDYRHSVLIFVFARLIKEGWMSIYDRVSNSESQQRKCHLA